jgi:hypothetical protein
MDTYSGVLPQTQQQPSNRELRLALGRMIPCLTETDDERSHQLLRCC